MPLPLTVSCFWCLLTWVVPEKGLLNVCVCVCVCVCVLLRRNGTHTHTLDDGRLPCFHSVWLSVRSMTWISHQHTVFIH